jgi:hypothetical protein
MKRSEQYRYADMGALANVLAQVTSSDLGAGDVAKIKTELAKPAYGGKTPAERVEMLMAPVLVDNPVIVAVVRQSCAITELQEWLRPIIFTASPTLQQKWVPKSGIMFALYSPDYVVEYNAATFAPIRVEALADGLITQAQLDERFPLISDPSYSPKIWQTPIEGLLGDLSVVTLGDVLAAEE